VAARTISQPVGTGGAFSPWVEVSLLAQLTVPDWDVAESLFLHWAAPWQSSEARLWRPFDPGRRAASQGSPPGVAAPELTPQKAQELLAEVMPLLPRTLYRHKDLGLVSRLGETASSFRHRCLRAFAPTVREGLWRRDAQAAQAVARMLAGIQERTLGQQELEVVQGRVGLAWYPAGLEPTLSSESLMIEGGELRRP